MGFETLVEVRMQSLSGKKGDENQPAAPAASVAVGDNWQFKFRSSALDGRCLLWLYKVMIG